MAHAKLSLLILSVYSLFSDRVGFLFTTFFLYFFLSWTSSLSISRSAMSASTLSNHVLLGRPISLQLYTPYISSPSHCHISIPSQPTTSNDSCDRLNSNFLNYSLVLLSFRKHHTSICISALSGRVVTTYAITL